MRRLVIATSLVGLVMVSRGEGAFVWKDRIAVSDIPATPLAGVIHGKPFKAVYVSIKAKANQAGSVRLEIYNKKPKRKCGYAADASKFYIIFPADTQSKTWAMGDKKNPKKEGAGYSRKDKEGMVRSVGSSWAAAIVITSRDEYSVRGKLALCFKGKDGQKSWVAGQFNAVNCTEE